MKLVIISDTHGEHESLGSLEGDVLIHCGDIGLERERGTREIERLDAWFARQSFRLILCIGGNHDFGLEAASQRGRTIFKHAIYLQDAAVEFDGVNFYGAPWIPELRYWAFYQDAAMLKQSWSRIPDNTDVLITHTPARGLLDQNSSGRHCGCAELGKRIAELDLRLHCFGHIHASAGMVVQGDTHHVNASMVGRSYQVVRAPYEIVLQDRYAPRLAYRDASG